MSQPADPDALVSLRVRRSLLFVLSQVFLAILIFQLSWFGEPREPVHQVEILEVPLLEGRLAVTGPEAQVAIRRDRLARTQVDATSERDAWFGLGFAHARDRLERMFWLRRLALGRSAARVGEQGLPVDRLVRTLGIPGSAHDAVGRMSPADLARIRAYSHGVNAWLGRLQQVKRDSELVLLARSESFWEPAHSVAVLKLLGLSMGPSPETGLVFSDLVEELGAVGARALIPTGTGLVGIGMPFPFLAERRAERRAEHLAEPRFEGRAASRPLAGRPDSQLALAWKTLRDAAMRGRAWVIGGPSTTSGDPILAAEIETFGRGGLQFYDVTLRAEEFEVAGVTIPGLPVFWAGHNRDVAWALTPARVQSMQLYREDVRPGPVSASGKSSQQYRSASSWHPVSAREEMIEVMTKRGGLRELSLQIRGTRHGPFMNELFGRHETPLTLAWTGAMMGDGLSRLLDLTRAQDADALIASLQDHHDPILCVSYADLPGRAGFKIAGWTPRRRLATGQLPVPGSQASFDWRGSVDAEGLPSLRLIQVSEPDGTRRAKFGPLAPWAIVDDNPLIVRYQPQELDWLWHPHTRSEGVHQALSSLTAWGKVELSEMLALPADRFAWINPDALRALRSILAQGAPLGERESAVLATIDRWEFGEAYARAGAAAYRIMLDHLSDAVFGEALPQDLQDRYFALAWVEPSFVVEQAMIKAARDRKSGGWSDLERFERLIPQSLLFASEQQRVPGEPEKEEGNWPERHPLAYSRLGDLAPGTGAKASSPASSDVDRSPDGSGAGLELAPRLQSAYRMAVDLADVEGMLRRVAREPRREQDVPSEQAGAAPVDASALGLLRVAAEDVRVLILEPRR